ncbi:hypothetical protein JCM19239_678 [Vibrio variabilis]|uniref:Uncharacterized protein n=1 Tax=Vibrio variabilis TaxID=990271 RepID=A0ABQ0JKP0_9VIBR|nr:hypothetical protein JCM19239_678 [Vibrio variabilis]
MAAHFERKAERLKNEKFSFSKKRSLKNLNLSICVGTR